jgi:hypothetical protein
MLALEDQEFEATPTRYRTAEDRCRFRERALVRATAAASLPGAVTAAQGVMREGCPLAGDLAFNLLSVFVATERTDEALQVLAELEQRPPRGRSAGPYHHLAGIAYLRAGAPDRARVHLEAALRHGVSDCSIHEALAASSPDDPARASRSLEDAWQCERAAGKSDPRLLVAAANLAESAGDGTRATALRERAGQGQ